MSAPCCAETRPSFLGSPPGRAQRRLSTPAPHGRPSAAARRTLSSWIAKRAISPRSIQSPASCSQPSSAGPTPAPALSPEAGHEDFVFIHPSTRRRVTRNQIQIRLRTLARAAGLDPAMVVALSLHKLRHARARAMLQSGWHIAAVQSVLDHASIQTTQVYVEDAESTRLETLRT